MSPHNEQDFQPAPTPNEPSGIHVMDAITWPDVLRWSAIIGPIVVFAFWFGGMLTNISNAQATMQSDVNEIKASIKAHNALGGHAGVDRRVMLLEHYHKAQQQTHKP